MRPFRERRLNTSHPEPHPPIPEELWMLCAYGPNGENGRWVGSHIVGLYVVATDEQTAEMAAMEHRKKYDQGCICIPVLVKSAEKTREEQRRPTPTLKPYVLPNGDTIKLADVDYIKYRLSRMTDATSTLDRPILVVGLKSEPVIEGTYVEIHLKFDSDDAVINAYYALDSAVRAYRKSQPSQDPH